MKASYLWSRNLSAGANPHRWKHQALIDAGVKDGLYSQESAELRAARKSIRVLEQELQLVKDASELFDAQAVVPPKDGRPLQKDS